MSFKTPRSVDRAFTRKFKEMILNAPLIDTFALYRSIDVTAEIDLNYSNFMSADYTFTVKIYAEEYLVYHIEPMDLVGGFIYSQSFFNSVEKLRQEFIAYLSKEYPLIKFDNIYLELSELLIMNTPQGMPIDALTYY